MLPACNDKYFYLSWRCLIERPPSHGSCVLISPYIISTSCLFCSIFVAERVVLVLPSGYKYGLAGLVPILSALAPDLMEPACCLLPLRQFFVSQLWVIDS